jgi:beta-galactosidase GanA
MLFLLFATSLSGTFTHEGDTFLMNGKPFRWISGSFHYFRQHPSRWEDTIKKMAAAGLNCVETYIAWNFHEPQPGVYYWDDWHDIERFIKLIQKYGMYCILRPGPYICGEWEFGGLPYWLLNKVPTSEFRTSGSKWLAEIDKWLTLLYTKVAPYMFSKGGPIILVQIENEYGYFKACDRRYMTHLLDLAKQHLGADTMFFTTDQNKESSVNCGSLPGIFATIDFGVGGDITGSFALEKRHNGRGPYVNSEYWAGAWDNWGSPRHNTQNDNIVASDINKMLGMDACINMYMFEGGTSFGFMTGADGSSTSYTPLQNSYDVNAALSEAADMTWKYTKIKEVIAKYRSDVPKYEGLKNYTKKAYGTLTFNEGVALWDALPEITSYHKASNDPLTFEALGLDYGYVLYQAKTGAGSLNLGHVHDRAYVFVDQKRVGLVERTKERAVTVTEGTLDILVENMGRLKFGNEMAEFKGLIDGAKVGGAKVTGWEQWGFNMSKVENLKWGTTLPWGKPGFFRATFRADAVADTFLNPKGWTKGCAFINGFNLGRYWHVGPQLTLYIPAPLLKVGENEIIVFEAEATSTTPKTMTLDAVHNLG